MASRFAALSPWRNLAAKPLPAYSEVPVAASDVGRGIALIDDTHIVARGAAPGALVILKVGEEFSGKYGNKAESVNLPTGAADIQVAPFAGGHIAVGGEDGSISLLRRPQVANPLQMNSSWKHPDVSGPVLVRWHPRTHLLLSASASSPLICVWKTQAGGDPEPALSFMVDVGSKAAGKYVHDLMWNTDGSKFFAALADGTVKLYDPRSQTKAPLSSTSAPFGVPKPIRIAVTSKYLLSSTLNLSRQRELRIYASDDLSRTLQVLTLDTASHPLSLTVDHDRNLVFLGSKGDVTLRWIELDDNRKFPQGAFPLPPRTAFGTSALLPPIGLDVMQAEINRLYVLTTSGEVIPICIEIPQRQLIDFHPHLYPDTAAGVVAVQAEQWLNGQDGELIMASIDPVRRKEWLAMRQIQDGNEVAIPSAVQSSTSESPQHDQRTTILPPRGAEAARSPPVEEERTSTVPAVADVELRIPTGVKDVASEYRSESVGAFPSEVPTDMRHKLPAAAPLPATVGDSISKSTSTSTPHSRALSSKVFGTPPSSSWSRTTLSGFTPLLPAFSSVPAFDVSISPSARPFFVTPLHLLYPLTGAGGRLAFHEITREGRLPEAQSISWIETGYSVADFEADIFQPQRVATVGNDCLRIWKLPEALPFKAGEVLENLQREHVQTIINTPELTLELSQLGKACKVSFNPIASDILLVAGEDGLAVIDVSRTEIEIVSILEAKVAEAEWSTDGSLIAFARSDRKLVLWDPKSSVEADIVAHDSSRPFKVCWIDEAHLITVGHMAGSTRQVKLFHLSRTSVSISISEKGRLALDTSPAILFPHYDGDADLIYLWSKGERSISVLRLALDPLKPKFGAAPPLFKALPTFQHSTPQLGISFLPKRYCNVKAVELGLSYRLTRSQEIQIVSWRVERKRKDYFQDDVFPPTRDIETPAFSAGEWRHDRSDLELSSLPHIDLHPPGMVALSQAAPGETMTSALAKGPTQRMITAKEREDELMTNVFSKAKGREGEEEEEETAARRRAPDDDDWGDD